MTREQALKVEGLTDQQLNRLTAYFDMQSNLNKEESISATDDAQVIEFADSLIKRYEQRKAREAAATQKKQAIEARNKEIIELVEKALKYISIDQIKETITNTYKKAHNEEIEKQIAEIEKKKAELKGKLI